MPYNFVTDSFHTKKLCSRLSSSEVRFYTENGRFRGPPVENPCSRRDIVYMSEAINAKETPAGLSIVHQTVHVNNYFSQHVKELTRFARD